MGAKKQSEEPEEVEAPEPEDYSSPCKVPDEWNIGQRMLWVTSKIEKVVKDLTIKMGGEFKAVSHDAVVGAVRQYLVDAGILVLFLVDEVKHEVVERLGQGGVVTGTQHWIQINGRVRFVNALASANEDDMQMIEVPASGTALDSQDKGYGKAVSYMKKYALLANLLIETGEDTDKGAGQPERGKTVTPPQRRSSGSYDASKDERPITEPQRNRLYGIAKDHGWTSESLLACLREKSGNPEMKISQIKRMSYEAFVTYIENHPPPHAEDEPPPTEPWPENGEPVPSQGSFDTEWSDDG
jgi:hypothetical protein